MKILDPSVYSGEVSIISKSVYGEVVFIRNYQNLINKVNHENESMVSDFLLEGGAITLFTSRLKLQINTTLSQNVASNGGGITAVTSTIVCNSTLTISMKSVTDTGGGLYLYQSELSVYGVINVSKNRAKACGGGVHAISTFLKLMRIQPDVIGIGIRGKINFTLNAAEECGGGTFLETGSKINVLRYSSNAVVFIKNTADYGGAVYVADDTNVGMCSSGEKHKLTATAQSECFFQLLSVTKPKIILANIADDSVFKKTRQII